jgi:hypothetical protein
LKKICILLFTVIVILNTSAFAEDIEKIQTDIEVEAYHFPEIKPEILGLLGYRFLGLSGSEKAGEYEYLHNSVIAGGEIRLFPFPHRIYLETDMLNKKDYFIDMSYAYSDLILFRGINRTLYHNLDNMKLYDLNTATSNPGISVMDSGERYGIKAAINNIFLRFKTPDFPLHVYLDGSSFNKEGEIQQRFMGGAAYFTNNVRVSQKRRIDWEKKDITIGTNSHLGPIEIELSHNEKRFDSGNERVLSYSYASSPVRAAGTYPHNLVPDLKSSTNTLKLHTSYTGRLVASTTLSKTDKENIDSKASADYFTGAFEVSYIPHNKLVFVARYRHRESDLNNPSSIPAGYLGYSSYTTSLTNIRPSISSDIDTFYALARYRPLKGLGINAEYTYEITDRKNAKEWELPEETTRKNFTLSANVRPMKKLTFKIKYTHQDMDNPAYNTQPNNLDRGSFSVSWSPVNWGSAMLSYSVSEEKRERIHYVGQESTTDAENRRANRDRFLGSVTFMLLKQLSFTTSYAYIHNRILQDLIYNSTTGRDQLDRNVPYKDTAHSYGINLNYVPQKNLTINADASQTKGKGGFYPNNSAATLPISIASFSDLKIRESIYSINSEYMLNAGWTIGVKCKYNSYKDIIDNVYDDTENGIVRIVMLTLSKRW